MQRDFPRDLTLEGVREQMELLAAEDARAWPEGEDGCRRELKLNHNRRATLWRTSLAGPIARRPKNSALGFLLSEGRPAKAGFPAPQPHHAGWESEDTSSLARFTWLAPEPLDPRLVARMISLPMFKSKVPCFWVPGTKVIDCIMLERIAEDTYVYYQLLKTPRGELKDACFASSYRELGPGVYAVGEWAVDHPKCPYSSTGTVRGRGMAGYIISMGSEKSSVNHPAGEIRGVAQMTSCLQEAAAASFLNGYDEFRMSRLGCECEVYLQAGMLSNGVLREIMPFAWRWGADVGLWTKGRLKNTKVWRSGQSGTFTRGLRFQGNVPGVHAGTLAQAMLTPEFRKNIKIGPQHAVLQIQLLETLGTYAQVVHVIEEMHGKRREYCVASCVASTSLDTWVVGEWNVEHPMAPRVKRTPRILPRTVYIISGQNEDTSLVVCREATISPKCPCWGTAEEVEAELDAFPFAFADSMSTLLPSAKGKDLLAATPLGLRGHLMHGGTGLLPSIAGSLPCMLDCLDALLQHLAASACCGPEKLLRIYPAQLAAA